MSKQCPNCHSILADDATFCNVCGTQFTNGQQNAGYAGGYRQNDQYQQGAQQQQQYQYQGNNNQQQQQSYYNYNPDSVDVSLLVDPNEKVVDKLSASPLINFLTSGGITKTEMFFTEKRLYIKRKEFSLVRGLTTRNDIVELKDVSGTRLLQVTPIYLLVLAALIFFYSIAISEIANSVGPFILGLFITAVFVLLFFLRRGVRMQVFYPGGNSALLLLNCNYQTAALFHRNMRLYVEANAVRR